MSTDVTTSAYVVQNASTWVYDGSGFQNGSQVPGLVGYEYDWIWSSYTDSLGNVISLPPQPGLIVLSNSPTGSSADPRSNSTIYTAGSGARVFAAGTVQWSSGLSNVGWSGCSTSCVNAGIKQTTINILGNFGS